MFCSIRYLTNECITLGWLDTEVGDPRTFVLLSTDWQQKCLHPLFQISLLNSMEGKDMRIVWKEQNLTNFHWLVSYSLLARLWQKTTWKNIDKKDKRLQVTEIALRWQNKSQAQENTAEIKVIAKLRKTDVIVTSVHRNQITNLLTIV